MKFIYKEKEHLSTLYDVNFGDLFLLAKDSSRTVFMRCHYSNTLNFNAINLSSGELVYIKIDDHIIPVDATLTVTHP